MAQESFVLIGFMGMGKSTVGPRAAEALGIEYYDTDDWLETEMGIDIPTMITDDRAGFRRLEAQALADILEQEPGVASTGGGIVETPLGRLVLRAVKDRVIHLDAPFETAVEHVKNDKTGRERPLFDQKNLDKTRATFDERHPWYEGTAGHTVDASQTIDRVVADVVEIGLAA